MWESNITDEFFVGTTEFNLTWDEIKTLGHNSLSYAFLPDDEKKRLVDSYEERISRYERDLERRGIAMLGPMPETRQYICRQYALCNK
jgi:adenosine deaminase CECR1